MDPKQKNKKIKAMGKQNFNFQAACPYCNQPSNKVAGITDAEPPAPGDFLVCGNCFNISRFSETMRLTKAETNDPDILAVQARARNACCS